MGYMKHEALVATTWREDTTAAIEKFRDEMPEDYRHLLVGPVPGGMNGYISWAFMPDGSKEGWTYSDEAHDLRVRFAHLCDELYVDWSFALFSGDDEFKRHITDDDGADAIG